MAVLVGTLSVISFSSYADEDASGPASTDWIQRAALDLLGIPMLWEDFESPNNFTPARPNVSETDQSLVINRSTPPKIDAPDKIPAPGKELGPTGTLAGDKITDLYEAEELLVDATTEEKSVKNYSDPTTHPVFQWEQEFFANNNKDDDYKKLEDNYRQHLLKVQKYLQGQNIETEYYIDYQFTPYGHAHLRIKPQAQTVFNLNQWAFDLAKAGFRLEYGTMRGFLHRPYNPDHDGWGTFTKAAARRWFVNSIAFSNLSNPEYQKIIQDQIAKFQNVNQNPIFSKVFSNFMVSYQNYRNLSVDLTHPLPYLAELLDADRQIYIPFREGPSHNNRSISPWAYHNYRMAWHLEEAARQLHDGTVPPRSETWYRKLKDLRTSVANFEKELVIKIIDLNAMLYLMMEYPENVSFRRNPIFPKTMDVFINETFCGKPFAYILRVYWPDKILARGDAKSFYTSPIFQFFYRYHTLLYFRLVFAKVKSIRLDKTDPAIKAPSFLNELEKIGKEVPQIVQDQVENKILDYAELRGLMQKIQGMAITNAQMNKHYQDKQAALGKNFPAKKKRIPNSDWCARQVTRPVK